ncbi:hypothetical protein MJO28_014511 [Puccinia striiformis f. sp. tritici]|uniref:Uncharacterized protein n=1 Tax=Puccinia striiformis f. sp. tritici TaxID=168172 RepID=A0ACC0DTX0_9BASI|nr:hypothetical protein MJO28_014511 [Puccinia striiformis f. sp. tritici]
MQLLALITLLLLTASMAVVARTKKECNLGSGITVLYLCFKPEDLTQNLHRVPDSSAATGRVNFHSQVLLMTTKTG